MASFGFNRITHPCSMMGIQMIQHHRLSRMQTGGQNPLDGGFKRAGICRSLQDQYLSHPSQGKRGDQSRIGSGIARNLPNCSGSSGRACIQWSQSDMRRSTFIDKNPFVMSLSPGLHPLGCLCLLILLGVHHRLFFGSSPG